MTMSAAFRAWSLGLEMATLIFLTCGAPWAETQKAGKIHNVARNL
jgi:hypothetical protein